MVVTQSRRASRQCGMRTRGSVDGVVLCISPQPFCISSTAACTNIATSRGGRTRRPTRGSERRCERRRNHPHLARNHVSMCAEATTTNKNIRAMRA